MTVSRTYETVSSAPRFAVDLVDALAQELKVRTLPPPADPLSLTAVSRISPSPADPLVPPLELLSYRNKNGVIVLTGDAMEPGPNGRVLPLRNGRYRIQTESPFYQPLRFELNWAPPIVTTGGSLALLPTAAYPFPSLSGPAGRGMTLLSGSLYAAGGAPITDATVTALVPLLNPAIPWPFFSCRTSQSGDWTVLLPDQKRFRVQLGPEVDITLRVLRGAGPPADFPNIRLQCGRANALSNTSLRGNAINARGQPLAGVRVATSIPGGPALTDANGRWAFYFPLDQANAQVTVTATDPNGVSRNVQADVFARRSVAVPTFQFP